MHQKNCDNFIRRNILTVLVYHPKPVSITIIRKPYGRGFTFHFFNQFLQIFWFWFGHSASKIRVMVHVERFKFYIIILQNFVKIPDTCGIQTVKNDIFF